MIAVPVLPDICTRFAGHSSKASFLVPITREFQGVFSSSLTRKRLAEIHFAVPLPNGQEQTGESANTCPFGRKGRDSREPAAGLSLRGYVGVLLLPQLSEEVQMVFGSKERIELRPE